MATAITPEQVTQLIGYQRHKDICKQWVRDIATFLRGLSGEDGNRAGMTPTDWARKRMIAGRIANHPNAQDFDEWVTQMTSTLKGQSVWDTDLDTTVNFLTSSGKYDEIVNTVYSLRMLREEF